VGIHVSYFRLACLLIRIPPKEEGAAMMLVDGCCRFYVCRKHYSATFSLLLGLFCNDDAWLVGFYLATP
jgi:hypothetical protein